MDNTLDVEGFSSPETPKAKPEVFVRLIKLAKSGCIIYFKEFSIGSQELRIESVSYGLIYCALES